MLTYNFELCHVTAQTSHLYGFTKVIKLIAYIKKSLCNNGLYADYSYPKLVAIGLLCSYNPIHCSVYGLCWSCVARPASVQEVIAIDTAINGRGCGHASVELHVVVSANVKTAVVICSFNYLIALEGKCCCSNDSNFIVRFMTCMLNT